eukprot:7796-Heterococcus_DN1.PRE.4
MGMPSQLLHCYQHSLEVAFAEAIKHSPQMPLIESFVKHKHHRPSPQTHAHCACKLSAASSRFLSVPLLLSYMPLSPRTTFG